MKAYVKCLCCVAFLVVSTGVSIGDTKIDGQVVANNVKLKGKTRIEINGQSQVSAGCNDKDAEITVWIDGGAGNGKGPSKLTVAGKCKKLVIERQNGQTTIDARELVAEEVLVKDMNGQTTLYVNTADMTVENMDGQSHIYFKKYSATKPLIELNQGGINGQSTV